MSLLKMAEQGIDGDKPNKTDNTIPAGDRDLSEITQLQEPLSASRLRGVQAPMADAEKPVAGTRNCGRQDCCQDEDSASH